MVFTQAAIIAVGIVGLLVILGLVISRLFKKATKERAFVRTGLFGEVVCVSSGKIVLPFVQDIVYVNLNTIKLEVQRAERQALITKDRLRVDVVVECFLRVRPDEQSIAVAAQTLGNKTHDPALIRELVEGKVTDALRTAAAEMAMEQLHEHRSEFVQRVQNAVGPDLLKNGLELEAVSLTRLDQTSIAHFDESNFFDSNGLTLLTETIEQRRKERNKIKQDTAVEIQTKNVEAEQQQLKIQRELSYSQMEQERELSVRKAEQDSLIATEQANREREAKIAQIQAEQQVNESRIEADRTIKEREIESQRSIKQVEIEQQKAIELSMQDKEIAISEKSELESLASKKADEARAHAVKAREQVVTSQMVTIAEREKVIEVIEATKIAERDAVSIKVEAEALREASINKAEALKNEAQAKSDSEIILAQAKAKTYEIEAKGQREINEARNVLSAEQIAMNIRVELLKALPQIIEASVRPAEKIDSIKIVQLSGLNGGAGSSDVAGESNSSASLSDQVVNSALKYRTQAPLLDGLMQELGINGSSLDNLTQVLVPRNETKLTNDSEIIVGGPAEASTELHSEKIPVQTSLDV